MKKLPDTEFKVMKVIWSEEPPITANTIMQELGEREDWKSQTAISLLKRLVQRNFLKTEKVGNERLYYPVVSKEDYLQFETENFLQSYHENSFRSFFNTLYGGKDINTEDLQDIQKLLEEMKK